MRAIIKDDLISALGTGDAGVEVPAELAHLPAAALRWDGAAIIDARTITEWWIDARGRKRLAQDAEEARQALTCAWDDRLLRDGDTWRVEVPTDTLPAYLADKRWRVETGGITVNGVAVRTDDTAQRKISELRRRVEAEEIATPFAFKAADGWHDLDAAAIVSIDQAVAAHIQACYATERALADQIAVGAITTEAEIDAADWPGAEG